jgi:hypothetical protein
MAAEEFGSGSIFPKPGNENVLVLKITDRRVLRDSVVPFLRHYMRFSARVVDYEIFATAVDLVNQAGTGPATGSWSLSGSPTPSTGMASTDECLRKRCSTESSEAIRWTPLATVKRWSDLHGDVES